MFVFEIFFALGSSTLLGRMRDEFFCFLVNSSFFQTRKGLQISTLYMIGISLIIASFVEDLLTSHSFGLSIIDRLSLIKSAFFIRAIYTKHSRHFA